MLPFITELSVEHLIEMENFDEMWTLMEIYSFDRELELHKNLTCTICNKLIIDAFQGPCGCCYCRKCIYNYIVNQADDRAVCPSRKSQCVIRNLQLKMNIIPAKDVNIRISRSKVKCPMTLCQFSFPLIEMCNHLRSCDKMSTFCPFKEINCAFIDEQRYRIPNHLLHEFYQQKLITIKKIKILRDEINSHLVSNSQKAAQNKLRVFDKLIEQKIRTALDANEIKEEVGSQKPKEKQETESEVSGSEKNKLRIKRLQGQFIRNILEKTNPKVQEVDNINQLMARRETIKKEIRTVDKLSDTIDIQRNKHDTDNSEISSPDSVTSPFLFLPTSNEYESGKIVGSTSAFFCDVSKYLILNSNHKFYSSDKKYEMWLEIIPGGCAVHNFYDAHVCLAFVIKEVIQGKYSVTWPVKCSVGITIKSVNSNNQNQLVSKQQLVICQSNFVFAAPQFHFPRFSLTRKDLIENDSIWIECSVEIEKH